MPISLESVPRDRFIALQQEIEIVAKRLKQTKDAAERRILLREIREILAKLDKVVEQHSRDGWCPTRA